MHNYEVSQRHIQQAENQNELCNVDTGLYVNCPFSRLHRHVQVDLLHYWNTVQLLYCSILYTALVTSSRAYSIQTGGPGPPSSAWQRSRIPRTVHSAARRSDSIITAIRIIQSPSHPASSSLDCTVGARAFTVSGPALWNSLPSDITSIDSLSVFRRHLEKYFNIYSVIHIQALLNNYTFLTWPKSFLCCTWSR